MEVNIKSSGSALLALVLSLAQPRPLRLSEDLVPYESGCYNVRDWVSLYDYENSAGRSWTHDELRAELVKLRTGERSMSDEKERPVRIQAICQILGMLPAVKPVKKVVVAAGQLSFFGKEVRRG